MDAAKEYERHNMGMISVTGVESACSGIRACKNAVLMSACFMTNARCAARATSRCTDSIDATGCCLVRSSLRLVKTLHHNTAFQVNRHTIMV